MRQNKVLGLAIATALSLGVSSSYAGELAVYYGGWAQDSIPTTATTGCSLQPGAPTFSSEYMFNPDPVLDGKQCGATIETLNDESPDPAASTLASGHTDITVDDRYFYAVYTVEATLSSNFQAKFELSNGATFGADLEYDTTNLDFVPHPSGTHAAATPSSGGNAGDSEVTFLIQPDDNSTFSKDGSHTLFLRYTLDNLDALQSAGEEIELTVSLYDAAGNTQIDTPSITKTVATSDRGSELRLESETGAVYIDVSTGSINFTGSTIISETMVALGAVSITSNDGTIKNDGSQWQFTVDEPTPDSATLTIINGNFAASVEGTTGAVFLDMDGDGTLDTETDAIDRTADSLTIDTAIWNLDSDDLSAIVTQTESSGGVDMIIMADGTTEINEFSDPPEATLVISYSGSKDTFTKKLRHIKGNGTKCTLYNVPNPNAIDEVNIRISNTSGSAGVLRGSLRDMDGTYLFKNALLLAEGETIASNQTIRFTNTDIDAIVASENGGTSTWTARRAVLTISSDVTSMEMFALLRSKTGGPLINLSVGGTGNGCD